MPEYRINDLITLRLEDGKTNIYVNGEEFIQCKYLLMNITVREIELYDGINSIDEAAEKLERFRKSVPSEVEFWGHCSNLQVWVEQDYDTRFIHRNLAFS